MLLEWLIIGANNHIMVMWTLKQGIMGASFLAPGMQSVTADIALTEQVTLFSFFNCLITEFYFILFFAIDVYILF